MGVLCALAGAIASARLNGSTLDVGQSYELYVIAAAGGRRTSFAGWHRDDPRARFSARTSCSRSAYGLSFMGVNSPWQNVVAGIVPDRRGRLDTINRDADRERKEGTTRDRGRANAPRRDARHQRRVRWRATPSRR
jgi:ABC-type xylose transport system permease subunit